MGQKIHPIGFRIGVSKNHKSIWYSDKKNYSNFLKEDSIIRNYITKKLGDLSISEIKIDRKLSDKIIYINCINSNQIFKNGNSELLVMQKDIAKLLSIETKNISINVIEVENPDNNAKILAGFVRQQLEKRIPFRRAMKSAIAKAQKANVKGIKVQVSGRLNGAEIARTEWIREGKVPLHTLKANIDYYNDKALKNNFYFYFLLIFI